MARVEWRFQRLGTSVTSCWRRSCSVSPKWSPGGPIKTTPCGGRSLWGGAPGPMSGPMATFSDSRGGGSFQGTRPPWEESSGRFSSPDQSPNFGMSPEFSQGSTRPPIFYQGSDSFRPSESYSSGRGQHPPGFWVPPEGGSAENIALDCKVQELIRAFHSVKQEVQAKQEQDQAFYQRWQRLGLDLSPLLASLVVHHWSGSGLGLRTLGGLRLLSQADALRRLRLQESSRRQLSLVVGCRRGSLPGLTMTSVVGALVSHPLHHTQPWEKRGGDVLVTGVRRPGRIHILTSWVRQWNLLLGTF